MLCQECKKNEATVLLNTNINGVTSTKYLCQQCAQNHGLGSFMTAGDLLAGMFSQMGASPMFHMQEKTCPECGYTLSQFKRNSLLGCDKCYTHFREELKPMIKRIHGTVFNKPDTDNASKTDDLSKLKAQLQEAIAKEDYERAAQLRDLIKDMEKKVKKGENK